MEIFALLSSYSTSMTDAARKHPQAAIDLALALDPHVEAVGRAVAVLALCGKFELAEEKQAFDIRNYLRGACGDEGRCAL
jgi:hypothetical protein